MLHRDLEEEVYMKMPPEYTAKGCQKYNQEEQVQREIQRVQLLPKYVNWLSVYMN